MKNGRSKEWTELILLSEQLVDLWKNVSSEVNGEDKLHVFFDELGRVNRKYLDIRNAGRFEVLTRREKEIVGLICEGLTISEIAHRLNITADTVETHRGNIFGKLHVQNVQQLILLSVRAGMVW